MKHYLQYGLMVVVVLIPFLSPVVLNPNPFNVLPENLKSVWGVVGVLLLFSVWLWFSFRRETINIFRSQLYLPLFGLLLWSSLSLWWADDLYFALVELSWLWSYGIAMIIVLNLVAVRDVELWVKLLTLSLLGVSIVGLGQYYFNDIFWVNHLFGQSAVPGATFVNKNMASHYVVMTLPLALLALLSSKIQFNRVLFAIVTAVGGWFLIYTSARQGYLAAAVEVVLLVSFLGLDFWKNREYSLISKNSEWALNIKYLGGILLFLILVSNWSSEGLLGEDGHKASKLKNITVEAGATRFPAWANTVEMVKDYPLRGVGIGQWKSHYHNYFDRVEKDVTYSERMELTRLHNDYLQTFAEIGLIGYLSLFWLLYLVVRKIFIILFDPENPYRWQVLGLSFGLVGFSVVAMFSFPVHVYLPAFLVFFYIGLIFKCDYKEDSPESFIKLSSKPWLLFAALSVSLVTVGVAKSAYEWIMAESHFMQAKGYRSIDEYDLAFDEQLKAVEYNSLNRRYQYEMGMDFMRKGKLKEALIYLNESIDGKQYDPRILLPVAVSYAANQQYDVERKLLLDILNISPHHVMAAVNMVTNYSLNKEYEKASMMYERMKKNYLYFQDRSGFGPYHDPVAQLASSVGDYEFAKSVYERAITEDPSAENYVKLGTIEFVRLENKARGVELFKMALKIDPMVNKHLSIRRIVRKYEGN